MIISRKKSRVIAFALLGLFFVVSVGIIKGRGSAVLSNIPVPALEGGSAKVVMSDFHRSEVRDGKKLWEIRASQGEFFPTENRIHVNKPDLTVYREEKQVSLAAEQADIQLEGSSVDKARVSGAVRVVYNQNTVIETGEATWHQKQQKVEAPGAVKLSNEMLDVEGEDLTVHLERNELFLNRRVRSVIKPRAKSK